MKKIGLYIIALFAMAGCQKHEAEMIFDKKPEERMDERLTELRDLLTNAPNGWKASLNTTGKGAYGFYVDFREDMTCSMVSDLTSETSSTLHSSTYRVIWAMNASLVFDTFNYVTMLQEPSSSFGGTAPNGYQSDIEFEYVKSSGDSVYMRGKKYLNDLVLVKASAEESKEFESGGYALAIEQQERFFIENENPYIEIEDVQIGLALNESDKLLSFTVLENGSAKVFTGKYFYSLSGSEVLSNIGVFGTNIEKLLFKEKKLYVIDSDGNEYEVKNSTAPILPLHVLMGVQFTGLRSPYLTYYSGTSNEGLEILQLYHEGLGNRATGYTFDSGYIDLGWNLPNKRITLSGFSSQNGGASGWTTAIEYDYTLDETTGVYTLTKRSDAAGGYVAVILEPFDEFLLNSRFRLDYQVDGSLTYGRIVGVERPEIEITFMLR